ncbi:hypothetical protein F503_03357 [Ophiostoma piceae UAMH 11346]|uniref:Gpr1 fun34-class plasma membrane protein n=1 Tax=Ophiostoma piceae (strain UAMH 11346) TaxID=1262450 RepID=S3D0Z0_OPHP1|nr:hypothetical protein F503_03357 [Ophiostoma piceae UAMH 11346]
MSPSTPSVSSNIKNGADLEAQVTISPRDQPALPYVPRNFANPAPLGLTAFATSIFMISLMNLHPRGVAEPNIIVSTMIMFGGLCQYISGIMEFVTGNTVCLSYTCFIGKLQSLMLTLKFGATVFSSFAGFNVAYALIFIPGTGIMAAYEDPATGKPLPELNQAIAMFVWTWFMVCCIFTVASTRASWALLLLFIFVDLDLLFVATYHMTGINSISTASSVFGFISAFLAYYAGAAGLWGNGGTAINLPVGSLAVKYE